MEFLRFDFFHNWDPSPIYIQTAFYKPHKGLSLRSPWDFHQLLKRSEHFSVHGIPRSKFSKTESSFYELVFVTGKITEDWNSETASGEFLEGYEVFLGGKSIIMFLQLLPAVVSIGVFCVYCVLESLRGFLKLPIYCVRLKSWELLDALRLPSHVVATLLPWALPSSPSWDCHCMWSRPTVTCNNVAGYMLLHVGCPACRMHYAEQQSM